MYSSLLGSIGFDSDGSNSMLNKIGSVCLPNSYPGSEHKDSYLKNSIIIFKTKH